MRRSKKEVVVEHPHVAPVHLSATPVAEHDSFPECLRAEVGQRAREIYERRTQWGLPGDEISDWLDAEAEVIESHEASPARLMPGGDLFPFPLDS
jgi:hypothetical protein